MADIVLLKDRKPRWTRRGELPGGGAEILLFTGIRYERRDAAPELDLRMPQAAAMPARLPVPGTEPCSG
ncbi:hypothetical protein M8R20_14775 [Pseudomonas sp. R2.Fl]|nr:hypothetical protein [Pseudomonas sp. R2.Fl]